MRVSVAAYIPLIHAPPPLRCAHGPPEMRTRETR